MIRPAIRSEPGFPDFEVLVVPHVDEMYRLARAIVGADDADDVTQNALVAAWRGLPRLRNTDGVRTWLHAIVVNAARDWLRARKRLPRAITVIDDAGARQPGRDADFAAAMAEHDRLDRAFAALSVNHRAVLALHYTLDLSVPEMAAVLGIPEGTVKSRVHGAVERMRAALATAGDA